MTPLSLATIVAGACVVCWITGYGFGRLERFIRRMFSKGVR
jgi:hypothetical protein